MFNKEELIELQKALCDRIFWIREFTETTSPTEETIKQFAKEVDFCRKIQKKIASILPFVDGI